MSTKLKKRSITKVSELSKITYKGSSERKFVVMTVERIVEKLREKRKEKGLSQEQLAELASVSVSTIKFIEQGQRVPSLAMLCKLLYVLEPDAKIWE